MVGWEPVEPGAFRRDNALGDAAHPMYPQGGNGGAQESYEAMRLPATSRIVLQNRSAPPNVIVDTVEQRTGGKRFARLEDVISQDELRTIFERYQKVAGYHVQQVGRAQG